MNEKTDRIDNLKQPHWLKIAAMGMISVFCMILAYFYGWIEYLLQSDWFIIGLIAYVFDLLPF